MQQLGVIIGENLRRLRADSGLSLQALSDLSGVSKSRLGQIERGEANPSVTTVWQIANALKVGFSALVTSPQPQSVVVSTSEVEPLEEDEGRYRVYPLFPFDPVTGFEVYLCEVDPGGQLEAEPHSGGTFETVTLIAGELTIETGGVGHDLRPGTAIRFRADAPHAYRNEGEQTAVCQMIIAYPRIG